LTMKPKIEKWVLSPHAVSRMVERKITTAEIEETIRKPDWALQQGPKWILAKHFPERSDNLLAAVVLQKEEANLWIVLTLMVHFEVRKN